MERLIEGHKRFLAEVFPGKRDQFHLLAEIAGAGVAVHHLF